jgi:all-trans-retinol 13,14-reductase
MGPATEIPGLFLCGASAPSGPGIAGVMRGGVSAAGAVLEVDLLRMVLEGRILGDVNRLPEIRPEWDAWRESH